MSLENYKEIHDAGNPDECGAIGTPCPWCEIDNLLETLQPVVDESVREGIYMVFTKEIFDNLKETLKRIRR
jgi:hypothetical protein